jgi:hypothetical protein
VPLALFGAAGLLLLGAAAWLLLGSSTDDGPFGIERQRRQLVALLDASSTALVDAQSAVRNADVSLGATAQAAGSAGTFMTELGSTLRNAGASLRITVFGSQPFALVADDFERVAAQADAVATDLGSASSSVEVAADDLGTLAADLREMGSEITRIRGDLGDPIDLGAWRLLVLAVLLWLAVPAVVSLAIGLRWMRR